MTRKKAFAVLFSAIMVLSMVASGGAGIAGAASEDVEHEFDDVSESIELNEQPAEVDDELLDDAEDNTVEAVVRLSEVDQSALATGDRDLVVDQLKSYAETSQEPVIEYAEDAGIEVVNTLWITNAILVEGNSDQLEELSAIDRVERIHPNHEYELPDVETSELDVSPDQDYTYGVEQINAPDVWDDFDTKGEGASVAVLDGGYDNDHQDLPEIHPDDQWQEWDGDGNPVESDPRSTSSVDHGVHVSGTIVGADDPVGDVPGFGVAPEATLYNGLVLPGGSGTFVQVAAGMEWSIDEWDVDIINMSLGGGAGTNDLIPAAEHIWQAGSILVASNGNNAVGAPGTYWSSFGSQAVDENENPASFADEEFIDDPDTFFNTEVPDHWPDEYQTPHASAAGVGVLSAQDGDGYTELSGTSMSAPHHAGMFALMVSHAGETDLEEFRQIAFDTAQEPPSDDPIFGEGISDAYAALEEVGPAVPEFDVGDATESGDRGPGDVLAIQQDLAGMEPEPYNENLADVNRDGDVSIADAQLLQQFLVGLADDGEIEVSNLEAPDNVEGGDEITVSADLENVGDLGTIQGIDFRVAESDDFENVLVNETVEVADLAPEGENSTASIEFTIDTTGLPGGDYAHGVFSNDDSATDEITITEPFFSVEDLDAPAEADSGDEIEVETTVENIGNQNDTQDVFFRFDPDGDFDDPLVELPLAEDLELAPGESETLSENVSLDGLEDGTFEHGVFTDNDQATADLKVNRWFFDVSDVEGPAEVEHGEEIEVNATVENIGNATDTQDVSYDVGAAGAGEDIAVVGFDEGPGAGTPAETLTEILEDEVGEEAEVEWIMPGDLLDEMDNHDVFFIHRFGPEDGDTVGDERAEDFFDELDDTQAAVLLDTRTGATDGAYPNAIDRSNDVRNIPGEYSEGSDISGQPHEIVEDHPLWTGIGDVGDVVDMNDGDFIGDDYPASFNDYDGEVIGFDVNDDQPGVGIDENPEAGLMEMLVTNTGPNWFTADGEDMTEEAQTLLGNTAEYAAFGEVTDRADAQSSHRTQEVTLDPDESQEVTFNVTIGEDDGVGDLAHVVASEDETASADLTVTSPEQVDITDLRAPAEAQQGDEIEVEADLEHTGSETTTQDVDFLFAGEVEATEEVTLDPGETDTVSFDVGIPVELEPGEYQHGVEVRFDDAFAQLEVLEADPANFAVDNLDAPVQVGQGQTFNASATIENTGDLEATQTIDYEFDIEEDDEGELDTVDVGVINYGDDTWFGDHGDSESVYHDAVDDHLDADVFEMSVIDTDDDLESVMDDYDVFVVHRIGIQEDTASVSLTDEEEQTVREEGGLHAEPEFEDNIQVLLNNLEDDQGAVYLDTWGSFGSQYPEGVDALNTERDDPETFSDNLDGTADMYHTIVEDHPIFDGVGDTGDTVLMKETGYYGYWDAEDDYSGDTLAEITEDEDGDGPVGYGVGVNDDHNEVLLSGLGFGSSFSDTPEERVEAGNMTLANSIEYAAEEALLDGAAEAGSDDITALDGSTEVTLAGGESAEVEFEFTVPADQPPIQYEHGIFSEDDEATDDIVILERNPDIVVTGQFPEDDSVFAGEEIATEAVVTNDGDAPGEREIRLNFGGTIVDTEMVELDPGEVTTVDLAAVATNDEAPRTIVSVNGQDPAQVEVTAQELRFDDQALGADTDENSSVSVEVQAATAGNTIAVTYTDDGDEVIAGTTTLDETIDEPESVTVEIEDAAGFPGDHTAHLITEVSDDTLTDGVVSAETADNIVSQDGATVYDADVAIDDQQFEDATEEVVVNTSDLQPDDEYVIVIHEDDGDLPVLGNSGDLTGAQENVSVDVDELNATTGVVAMLHFADDEDDFGAPITALDGTNMTPITDTAEVEIQQAEGGNVDFADQALGVDADGDTSVLVEDVQPVDVVTVNDAFNPQDDFLVLTTGEEVEDADDVVDFVQLSELDDGDDVVFEALNASEYLGEYTAVLHEPMEDDGDLIPDPDAPRTDADSDDVVNDSATVLGPDLLIENQTYEGSTDTVDVEIAAVFDEFVGGGFLGETEYVVGIYDGADSSGELLGVSEIKTEDNFEFEVDVDEIDATTDIAGVLHFADEDEPNNLGGPIQAVDGDGFVDFVKDGTAEVEIQQAEGGNVDFQDQAIGADTDGDTSVLVEDVQPVDVVTVDDAFNPQDDFLVLTEGQEVDDAEDVIDFVQLSELEDGDDVAFNVTGATPGEHTAVLHEAMEDDGDLIPDPDAPRTAADTGEVVEDSATVYAADIAISDEEYTDETSEVDVDTSDLQPNDEYVIVIHEDDEELPVLGNSGDLTGAQDDVTVTLDESIDADTDVVAMLHFADDEDDFGAPITALDGTALEPVTDTATVGILDSGLPTALTAEDTSVFFDDENQAFTAEVTNAIGEGVEDVTVTIDTVQSDRPSGTPVDVETGTDGIAEFSFDESVEGEYPVSLFVDADDFADLDEDLEASLTVTVTGAADSVAVDQQPPAEVTAGEEFEVAAQTTDSEGSAVSGVDVTVEVADGTSLNGETTVETGGDGVATFDNLAVEDAGDEYELEFSISESDERVDEGDTATSDTFDVTAAAADDIEITDAPSSIDAGDSFDVDIEATDEFGNDAAGQTITDVTLNAETDGEIFGPENVTLDGDASATLSVGADELTTAEDAVTVTAAGADISSDGTVDIDVNAGAPATLTADDVTAIAGADGEVEAVVEDEFENPVADETVTVDTRNSDRPSGFDTDVTTDADGVATFSFNEDDEGVYPVELFVQGADGVTDSLTVTIEAQQSGDLDIDVDPGEQNVENDFTYTFDASAVTSSTDVEELFIDFNTTSGIDTEAIGEDDVTVTGDDSGTLSVDSVQEDGTGELTITMADTFVLGDEDGDITVEVNETSVPESGTFDSTLEFRDDASTVIADGSADYEINATTIEINQAEFDDGDSESDTVSILGGFTSTAGDVVDSITIGFGNIAGNVGLGNVDAGNVGIEIGGDDVGNVGVSESGDDLEVDLDDNVDLSDVDNDADIDITIDDIDTTEATADGDVSVELEDEDGNTIADDTATSSGISGSGEETIAVMH